MDRCHGPMAAAGETDVCLNAVNLVTSLSHRRALWWGFCFISSHWRSCAAIRATQHAHTQKQCHPFKLKIFSWFCFDHFVKVSVWCHSLTCLFNWSVLTQWTHDACLNYFASVTNHWGGLSYNPLDMFLVNYVIWDMAKQESHDGISKFPFSAADSGKS